MNVKPFKALRPANGFAARVSSPPYDVINSDEAREMAKGNAYSFLHVEKSEIDLPPQTDPHDEAVYQRAHENLEAMARTGVLVEDAGEGYYIYRQTMDGRVQTGLVCCASVWDYLDGHIKKHEHTVASKEADRVRHLSCLGANIAPMFLTCRPDAQLDAILEDWARSHDPACDFISEDCVRQTVWTVADAKTMSAISSRFAGMNALFIADGHHRCASSAKVGQMRREANPNHTGREEYNFFLAAIFPCDQLRILDYNRVVKDLNGYDPIDLIAKISERFDVEESNIPVKPSQKYTFGMFMRGQWYKLTAKHDIRGAGPVDSLDVSVLQRELLSPVLGIGDPRTDGRIDFVGGIRGLDALEERTRRDMEIAFSMYPTSIEELMAISDAGLVMPPKSTWFEPKLKSGLFIHKLGG